MMEVISNEVRTIVTATFFVYTALLIAVAFISARGVAKLTSSGFVSNFFTGDRGMGVLMVAFVTAAGICSSGTFIGGPGLVNARGLGYALLEFFCCVFVGLNAIGTVGKKMGIVCRRIGANTFMDVLMARYEDNKILLSTGSLAIVVFLLSYCSSQFMGGARMLEVITGLDYKVSILLFSVVVVAYSTLGGIRGVGLAVILQGTVMTIGTLVLGIGAIKYVGGMENVFRGLEAFSLSYVQPQTENMGWMLSLWIAFSLIYLAMPHGALGSLSYKNTSTLHKAIFVSAICTPIWTIFMTFSSLSSISVLGVLEVSDHTTPLMAATVLHPILAGLTIAGACAAAQSTIAAMLLAISGTLASTVYTKIRPDASPKKQRTITLTATLCCGIITFLLALDPPRQLQWVVIFAIGGLASGFFWPMLLGLYWPRMNQWGAVWGVIGGIVVYMIGSKFYTPIAMGIEPIIIGVIASLIACVAASLLTKPTDERILRIFWGAEPITGKVR